MISPHHFYPTNGVRPSDSNYWEPKEWSGKALRSVLQRLKNKYNICTDKIFYYGYSAGSQASNLFAAWHPELCRAWVSHACGVFHEPVKQMKDTPGLVTCGDADQGRYIISRNFVEASRKKGVNIIWKSFPNHRYVMAVADSTSNVQVTPNTLYQTKYKFKDAKNCDHEVSIANVILVEKQDSSSEEFPNMKIDWVYQVKFDVHEEWWDASQVFNETTFSVKQAAVSGMHYIGKHSIE